jgi:hypothetical protein
MKAIVQNRYGTADVLELREIERPKPGDDEMLLRDFAASIHADVWHAMLGVPYARAASQLRDPRDHRTPRSRDGVVRPRARVGRKAARSRARGGRWG